MSHASHRRNIVAAVLGVVLAVGLVTPTIAHHGDKAEQQANRLATQKEAIKDARQRLRSVEPLYSDWTNFGNAWTGALNHFGTTIREYVIEEPAVDAAILARGSVEALVRFGGTPGSTEVLPHVGPVTKNEQQTLTVRLEPGEIRIVFQDMDGAGDDPGTFGSVNQYRYTIIPGGQPVS